MKKKKKEKSQAISCAPQSSPFACDKYTGTPRVPARMRRRDCWCAVLFFTFSD